MAEALAGAAHQAHVPFPRGLEIFITWILVRWWLDAQRERPEREQEPDGAALPKPSSITFTHCPGWGQVQRPTWV